jgi:hypothetical protein
MPSQKHTGFVVWLGSEIAVKRGGAYVPLKLAA